MVIRAREDLSETIKNRVRVRLRMRVREDLAEFPEVDRP